MRRSSTITLILLSALVLARSGQAQPAPVGPELAVTAASAGSANSPQAAMAPDGRYLVVWSEERVVNGVLDSDIRGRIFNREGSPIADSFRVNAATDGQEITPDVARLPGGTFVVVWNDLSKSNESIRFRLLDSSGSPLGADRFAGFTTYGDGFEPAVAASDISGDFVVVWSSISYEDTSYVDGRSFTADGTPRFDDTFTISAFRGVQPDVDVAPSGDFIVSWISDSPVAPTSELGLVAKRYNAAGNPIGSTIQLDPNGATSFDTVLNDDGSVIVAWQGNAGAPQARRFIGPTLTPTGAAIDLADSTAVANLSLAQMADTLFATWSEPGQGTAPQRNIAGRQLTTDLQLVGQPIQINTTSERSQERPALASNDAGRVIVAWEDEPTAGTEDKKTLRGQLLQAQTSCTPSMNRLCLNGGRFAVEALWRTSQGDAGTATAVPLTADTGYFTFFNPANVELVVKVLDACSPPFERFWVFAAGLTNVEVKLTVIDTDTGAVATYSNPQLTPFEPILDTDAFATCP